MSVDAHTCSCCAAADSTVAVTGTSRRTVLRASAGVLAGGVAVSSLAACGGSDDTTAGGGTTAAPSADATTPAGEPSAPAGGGDALATLSEVPVGGALAVNDGAIILVQPTAGTVLAFDSKCPHQGCKVGVTGTELVCPCHASKFDVATGDRTAGPATTGLTKVDVTVDGDNIVAG